MVLGYVTCHTPGVSLGGDDVVETCEMCQHELPRRDLRLVLLHGVVTSQLDEGEEHQDIGALEHPPEHLYLWECLDDEACRSRRLEN